MVPALIVNWYTSYQANKRQERQHRHDAKALEEQLKSQRKTIELSAEREHRHSSVSVG